MRRRTTQYGFGIIGILIILFVGCIITLISWRLYTANQSTDSNKVTFEPPGADAKSALGEHEAVPASLRAYENKTIGISFTYPATWGNVVVSPGPETKHLVAGSEYELTFSDNKAVLAGVRSNDWLHDLAITHEGGFYAGSFTNFDYAQYKMSNDMVNYVVDGQTTVVSTGLGGVGCSAVGELLVRNIPDNTKYQSIAFLYLDKLTESETANNEKTGVPPEDICAKENYKKYISAEHATEFKKINATIKVVK